MPSGRLRILARAALALLVTGLLFELATRALVFSDFPVGDVVAQRVRRVDAYAHPEEDLYWWLRVHFGGGEAPREIENYHPELGWTPWPTETFVHPREAGVGNRRPVLLYGDSFSACMTPPEDCFQGLMDQDPLGRDHGLLNFGSHAYGIDQIAMLLDRSVDRYLPQDPVVVVGLLVDRDLDRAGLSFRGTQSKPRFELEGGELVLSPPLENGALPPMPAVLLGPRLAVHSLPVPAAVHDLFCARRAVIERNKARCRAILTSIVGGLEERGVEYFFLLFHSRETLDVPTWEDALVTETLDGLGARWISTRTPLLKHAEASGRDVSEYFGRTDHFNALGNYATFRAIRDGLAGFDRSGGTEPWSQAELGGPLSPGNFARVEVGGRRGAVRYQYGSRAAFGANESSSLFFSVGKKGPSEVDYTLGARASSFTATARFYPMERIEEEGSVVLTILADGEEVLALEMARTDPDVPVRVELAGRGTLTLRVEDAGDGTRGDWFMLAAPRFGRAADRTP